MTKSQPIALLIGEVNYAGDEWKQLQDIAELREIHGGTRAEIIQDFLNGKYDGVIAIYRTFESGAFTGRFDDELVSALPSSVKYICHNGAGYDQIDVPACTSRGIKVSHTPQAVDNGTANVAVKLMLLALRRAWKPMVSVRQGAWRDGMDYGHDPEGKTLGIVGMGGIGSAFAKRAKAFDMNIVYCNRKEIPPEANPTGAKYVSFDELLRISDVISLHVPLTSETRHMIDREQLAKTKKGVIILNTARGPIINEEALTEYLENGHIYSAGLDVFEYEPKISPRLLNNPNVILFPHIGTLTYESQRAMESLVIKNVRSALTSGCLVTQVPEQRNLKL